MLFDDTEVARQDVLAYFMDRDYKENECIVDPARIGRIAYEHVGSGAADKG